MRRELLFDAVLSDGCQHCVQVWSEIADDNSYSLHSSTPCVECERLITEVFLEVLPEVPLRVVEP